MAGNVNIAPPIRDSNKCPAIMFAVSRNVRAIGRIKFLSSSTIDINLNSPVGVPVGTRCLRKSMKDFTHLK